MWGENILSDILSNFFLEDDVKLTIVKSDNQIYKI
jgi:hypothetical protein